MTARPWFKMFPSDWQGDTKLRRCPMAARGLWFEMLCIMHEGNGRLATGGERITDTELSVMVAMPERECVEALAILEKHGVFSREPDGTIYSRRMCRDLEKSARAKANGKRGGNPSLKGEDNQNPIEKNETQHKPQWNMASALEDTPSEKEDASPRARLDALEAEAREAAGLERDTSPSPSLFDLSPLLALLDAGYSWHNDILPKLREAKARGQKGRTWGYYVPAITEGKAKNSAIQPRASPPPMRWLPADSPEWPLMDDRSLRETGKHLKPLPSKAQMGKGAYVPLAWSGTGERA